MTVVHRSRRRVLRRHCRPAHVVKAPEEIGDIGRGQSGRVRNQVAGDAVELGPLEALAEPLAAQAEVVIQQVWAVGQRPIIDADKIHHRPHAVDFNDAGAGGRPDAATQHSKGRAARAGEILPASAGVARANRVPERLAQIGGGTRRSRTDVKVTVVGRVGHMRHHGDEMIAQVAGEGVHLRDARPAINPVVGREVISVERLFPGDAQGLVRGRGRLVVGIVVAHVHAARRHRGHPVAHRGEQAGR